MDYTKINEREITSMFTDTGKTIRSFTDNEAWSSKIKKLAHIMKDKQHMFLIGKGDAFYTALEGALKIKEISYIHAEAFAGGELKHGCIALIEKNTPVIVISSKKTRKDILSNAMELKSRGAYIVGIDEIDNETYDYHIHVPELGKLNSLIQVLPLQLFAYHLALAKNLDPDKPRNLAKSVTVK